MKSSKRVKRTRKPQKKKVFGFTIIEVLIVLAIAGLIMLIIILAVPKLQRERRNSQRKRDASVLLAAVAECLANRNRQIVACNEPSEINLDPATQFGQYTGFHFGASWPTYATAFPPTMDEPNWLFRVQCNAQGDFPINSQDPNAYVVAFFLERDDGLPIGRCIAS